MRSTAILTKSIFVFASKIAAGIAGLAFSSLLARLLGAEGTGNYYLTFSFVSILAMAARFGLDNTVIKFIAGHRAVGDFGRAKAVYLSAIKIVALLSIILMILFLTFTPLVTGKIYHNSKLSSMFFAMSPAIPMLSLSMLIAQLLKASNRPVIGSSIESLFVPVFAILFVFPSISYYNEVGAALAYSAGSLVCLGIGAFLLLQSVPDLREYRPVFHVRPILSSCLPLFIVSFMQLINREVPTLFLGSCGKVQDVGVFAICNRMAFVMSLIYIAITTVISPNIAQLCKLGKKQELHLLLKKSTFFAFLVATPIFLILIFFSEPILTHMFGKEFAGGKYIFIILACGQFVNIVTGPVQPLMVMAGLEKVSRNIYIISTTITFILCFILIPRLGGYGAAIVFSFSVILQNLWLVIEVQRRYGVSPYKLSVTPN